ncbi:hypothetical protein J14TS2_44970 [Bacillus sp. J14TS2]|uniref:hypothetical protein n=1 Tax=Bacillus sp. J14TS2 TaxID=2807188 RepID=UPI001B2CAF69|nr:hypothetical protein [Bacillus sp. J14TS2]GIN74022.1 hypothetical protein J14TS2_44970 [Bacillus sp. J14TS2]
MESVLLINSMWDYEIMHLFKQGLSDEKIAEQIPFGIEYVTRLRGRLAELSYTQQKGV